MIRLEWFYIITFLVMIIASINSIHKPMLGRVFWAIGIGMLLYALSEDPTIDRYPQSANLADWSYF